MDRKTVVLASLLHDIGKLIYRAVPPEQRHSNRHQELGFLWGKSAELPPGVREAIRRHHAVRPQDPKYGELAPEAYKGPLEIKNLIYLISEADNIASGMERGDFAEDSSGTYEIEQAMGVVFDKVALNRAAQQKYSWEPSLLEDVPYPLPDEEIPKQKVANFYKNAWASLRDALKDPVNFQEDRLLLILEKYLSQVPEYTYVSENSWPDTSLYYHLKSTAALSLCNYLYLTENGCEWSNLDLKRTIGKRDEKRYVFVGADLSGIQSFIYTISSKAALKTVRARSFFLDLMIESAATQLCEALGLGRSNLIYASGGVFFLLAPNTKAAQSQLDKFHGKFNSWLFENFGTSLYLCLATEELNGSDLMGKEGHLQGAWSSLGGKLRLQKDRKWESFILEDPEGFMHPKPVEKECQICHQGRGVESRNFDGTSLELCDFCSTMIRLGQHLPDVNIFYETKQATATSPLSISICDLHYHFSNEPHKGVSAAYQLKNPWDLPESDYPIRPFPSGSYYTESEFDKLASKAVGDKKIGVVRMDVDRLGQIFSRGLQDATFARMSDLSARLNQYFKYYLPKLLARSETYSFLPLEPRKMPINVIYAGGDDLFLVGTWDAAIEMACAINHDFRKFTCYNPDITISGGIVIADEKMPIYKLADMAAEAEAKAKDSGRNRLCLMGMPFTWSEIDELYKYLHVFAPQLEQDSLTIEPVGFSSGFLQRFGALVEEYRRLSFQEEGQIRGREDEFASPLNNNNRAWVYPKLYYLFARAMSAAKEENVKFYQNLLAVSLSEETLTRMLPPVLGILKLMLRGVMESANKSS